MAYSVKNSLFVRNLSPNVTEATLREVFGQCDAINDVVFRAFPNQNNQFFAQIDFKTSKGVAEGSALNGTAIMGTACLVGVIDPLSAKQHQDAEDLKMRQLKDSGGVGGGATASSIYGEGQDKPQGVQAEYFKQQKEAMEDQAYRTCHLDGFKAGVTDEALKLFCEHFGEVEACRIEEPEGLPPFALVEFKDRGSAHVVKTQKSYEVDGRVVTFTESKTMVNATAFAEKSVHFQQPIFDFMNMKAVLAQQGHLNAKLAQVREAAMSLTSVKEPAPAASSAEVEDESMPKWADKEDKKKDRKDKDKKKDSRKKRSKSLSERADRKKKAVEASEASEKASPKKDAKKKKKEKKEKKKRTAAATSDDDASAKASPKKVSKKQKKLPQDETSEKESPQKPVKKQKKEKEEKKKTSKMAIAAEDEEALERMEAEEKEAAEKAAAAQKEKQAEAQKDSDDESSSAPIDLDDPDGVDVVENTEKIVLGLGSSSSSSSSSKSSVDPDELELLPDQDAVECMETKEDPSDAVELVGKVLPMGSPAMTTPGDISSTDSDSSSDSPVREIAGEISDGDGKSPRRRIACVPPMRNKMNKCVALSSAGPIGLDEDEIL